MKHKFLIENYGIEPSDLPVATSEMRRTQQTALGAGFTKLRVYPLLNEVSYRNNFADLARKPNDEPLPGEILEAAQAVINDPPEEQVWFSHGLIIAGICQILRIYEDRRLVPRYCEIRELPVYPSIPLF